MFEVLYRQPADDRREQNVAEHLRRFGGRVTYREEPPAGHGPVVLTCEFDGWEVAEQAAAALRTTGEHVEGPTEYAG